MLSLSGAVGVLQTATHTVIVRVAGKHLPATHTLLLKNMQ